MSCTANLFSFVSFTQYLSNIPYWIKNFILKFIDCIQFICPYSLWMAFRFFFFSVTPVEAAL